MTPRQLQQVLAFLKNELEKSPVYAHHGDCVGADEEFHLLCLALGAVIIVHPPSDGSQRAYCKHPDEVLDERPYLSRNHDIVDASDLLIACPSSEDEKLRSGTWATVRYARKTCKTVHMFKPDGTWEVT